MLRYRADDGGASQTINLHKIKVPWLESEATWLHPYNGGGDWDGCFVKGSVERTPRVSCYVFPASGWYEWYGYGMAKLVQEWVSQPASNFGVLLKMPDDDVNADIEYRFHSSDVDDPDLRPKLEIVYQKDAFMPDFQADIVAIPPEGEAPLTVRFDASNSYSPSTIEKYSWDFDLTDQNDEDTTGKVINYTFSHPGEYSVALMIVDTANVRGYDTLSVFIKPQREVLELQPGPEEMQDNYMYYKTNWSESRDENDGTSRYLKVGTSDGDGYYRRQRSLLKFDLTETDITALDTVVDAKLYLAIYSNDNDGSNQTLNLHEVLVSWDEATSCWFRPETNFSEWDGCVPNDNWADSDPVASIIRNNQDEWYAWEGEALSHLVDNWVKHPEENNGLLVKLANDEVNADHLFRFYSSDESDSTVRPILEITYEKGGIYKGKNPFSRPKANLPEKFTLYQNYPNPFNPTTTIQFDIAKSVPVTLRIYNILGQHVKTLVDEFKMPGRYKVLWNGVNSNDQFVGSGVYIVRIEAGQYVKNKKLILMK